MKVIPLKLIIIDLIKGSSLSERNYYKDDYVGPVKNLICWLTTFHEITSNCQGDSTSENQYTHTDPAMWHEGDEESLPVLVFPRICYVHRMRQFFQEGVVDKRTSLGRYECWWNARGRESVQEEVFRIWHLWLDCIAEFPTRCRIASLWSSSSCHSTRRSPGRSSRTARPRAWRSSRRSSWRLATSLWSRLPDGKIWSLPFLGLRQGGGRGGARKGSNFAIWQP